MYPELHMLCCGPCCQATGDEQAVLSSMGRGKWHIDTFLGLEHRSLFFIYGALQGISEGRWLLSPRRL